MNRICISLLALSAVAGFVRAEDDSKWTLVWSDEFDGDKLDYSKWEAEVNAFGGGNDEQQMYTDRKENVRVENGSLVIEARKDNPNIQGTVRPFSSGRVRTKHRGDWKYGKIEARAKLPEGAGMWSAIWMLPTEEEYGGWAASGEIDIIEINGKSPETAHMTLHHGGGWPNNRQTGGTKKLDQGKYTDDFHVYAIEWNAKSIRWLIDEITVYETSDWGSANGKFPAPFDQEFHLLINLAVGGRFVGPPNEKTEFPGKVLVDYVRVYEPAKQSK